MPEPAPDAVRAPTGFAGTGDPLTRLTRLQSEFAGLLGVGRVFVRLQGTEHFLTGRPDDTLNYEPTSPRAGEPRYTWRDRGDGVLLGTRRPDEPTG